MLKQTMGNNITSTPYKLKAVSGPVTLIRKPSLDVPPLERRDADSQSSATQKAGNSTFITLSYTDFVVKCQF